MSPILGIGCIDLDISTAVSLLNIFADIFVSIILGAITFTLRLSLA